MAKTNRSTNAAQLMARLEDTRSRLAGLTREAAKIIGEAEASAPDEHDVCTVRFTRMQLNQLRRIAGQPEIPAAAAPERKRAKWWALSLGYGMSRKRAAALGAALLAIIGLALLTGCVPAGAEAPTADCVMVGRAAPFVWMYRCTDAGRTCHAIIYGGTGVAISCTEPAR